VLAPHSPLRFAVTALAQAAAVQPTAALDGSVTAGAGMGAPGVVPLGNVLPNQTEPAELVLPRRPAHYLWAELIARI